jgi:hypothetical protein
MMISIVKILNYSINMKYFRMNSFLRENKEEYQESKERRKRNIMIKKGYNIRSIIMTKMDTQRVLRGFCSVKEEFLISNFLGLEAMQYICFTNKYKAFHMLPSTQHSQGA